MRGYHIRIILNSTTSASVSPPTTSTSYKPPPPSQAFTPRTLFQPLPSHSQSNVLLATRRNTLSAYSNPPGTPTRDTGRTDFRLGPIRLDWVDLSTMDAPSNAFIIVGSGKEREKPAQRKGRYSFSTVEA